MVCQPVLGNQNYDALIEDRRSGQTDITKVEFTLAAEGYEDHLRMKVFAEKGHISLHGHVAVKGTKHTGHDIQINGYAIGENELTSKAIDLFVEALARKADKHYGQQHWLCVFCDDNTLFRSRDIIENTCLRVNAVAAELNLDFSRIFVLGYSGELLWEIK